MVLPDSPAYLQPGAVNSRNMNEMTKIMSGWSEWDEKGASRAKQG